MRCMDVCSALTVDAGTDIAKEQLQLEGVMSRGYSGFAPPHLLSKRYI